MESMTSTTNYRSRRNLNLRRVMEPLFRLANRRFSVIKKLVSIIRQLNNIKMQETASINLEAIKEL